MLLYWIFYYFYLAKRLEKYNNLHSIIHCVVSSLVNTYLLFGSLLFASLFDSEINLYFLKESAYHTLGYFIADTLDIFFYRYNDYHKRKYLFHHIFSIIAISTIYLESYSCIFGIWVLEIGGLVHHIKYTINKYDIKTLKIPTEILYHLIYTSSRIMIFLNITKCLLNIKTSENIISDVILITTGYSLVIQNTIWWYKNLKMLFN